MMREKVSRDLRSPLRALAGYGGLLLKECGDALSEEGRGYAGWIVAASQQITAGSR
jgi:hypothetical protein